MPGLSFADLTRAARSLRQSPTVALFAVACLAIGIGATTALWSAISAALLRPLPFEDPERLVAIHRTTPQSGPQGTWSQSPANFYDLQRMSTKVRGIAAATWSASVINLPTEAVQVSGHVVSGNFFQTLGARPLLGRYLLPTDDAPEAPRVVVISNSLWRSTFNGDSGVVGRSVSIDGAPTTIVGVTPPDFRVPVGPVTLSADLWSPIRHSPDQRQARNSNMLRVLGRLAPGVSRETGEAELQSLFAGIVKENPRLEGDNVRITLMHAESLAPVRRPLILIFGAVCMVLLIAATNVASLLLARGVRRRREFAVRAALGASRGDALRLVLSESLVLSGVGAALGVLLAMAGVRVIGTLAAEKMPQLYGLRVDGSVLLFALVLAVAAAMIAGVMPALKSMRVNPQDALSGGRGGGLGREHHRALRTLVVVEIAMSVVLLIGAGLVLKGFARLIAIDPGFDPSRLVTMRVTVPADRYDGRDVVGEFLDPALAALRSVPGVKAVSTISAVPYMSWGNNSGIRYEGKTDDVTKRPIVEQRQVTPGYFDVTQQRLIAGRLLTANDVANTPYVVVVNEALVKRDFPGVNPVGRRFHRSDTTFGTIVGVVSNVKNMGPVADPNPEMYSTVRQSGNSGASFNLFVRVRAGDPLSVVNGIRSVVRGIDPAAAISNASAMSDVVSSSLGKPRLYFSLLGTFAAVAVLLALAGLYGVLSYVVAQRTREIGIRTALGSTRDRIIRLFAIDGLRLVLIGVAFGLVGGAAVTRLMEFMLYGVSPLDAWTWVLATGGMILAAQGAVMVPAYRAARVEPTEAMRSD